MASIMGSHQYAKVLAGWDEMLEFEKGMVYGILKTRVDHMLEKGFGRRIWGFGKRIWPDAGRLGEGLYSGRTV